MRHLLVESEVSGRRALAEFGARCSLSGKRVLADELETSAVTGALVANSLLQTSALSGRRAEPEHFGICAFTKAAVLSDELAISEISGEPYRRDESMRSAASQRTGHKKEFIECQETRQPIALDESERCEVTGKRVRKGVLETCAETNQRVLPCELGRCFATGMRVLKKFLVPSSMSGDLILERAAVRSLHGKLCAPSEARECFWSGRLTHPDDLRICELMGLPVSVEYTSGRDNRLGPVMEMLDGVRRTADQSSVWNEAASRMSIALNGKACRIEAATLSPAGKHLAFCSEVKSMLGLKVRHAAGIFSLTDHSLAGRIPVGKRIDGHWQKDA